MMTDFGEGMAPSSTRSSVKNERLQEHMASLKASRGSNNASQTQTDDVGYEDVESEDTCKSSFGSTPPLLGSRSAFHSNNSGEY